MPRINIRISGSTMSAHVDAQNAILTALNAQCAGSYTLGTPKGSWDGEVRVLHLITNAEESIAAVVSTVDAFGCAVEVAAESDSAAVEPAATSTRRGGRKKTSQTST